MVTLRIAAVCATGDPPGDDWTSDEMDTEGEGQVITEKRVQTKRPRLYRIVLINDDYTPMEFVVWLIQTVFHKSEAESAQLMLKVHHQGSAVCGVYPYDVARTKLYQVKTLAHKHEHPLECIMEVEEGDSN
jgi:ATP-dependent Clp protease adaptor protein ClpS